MPTRKTLYLIDGHAQLFRAYHAIRGQMASPVTAEPTNATFGFVGMMLKLLRERKPDYLACTFDISGDTGTFRSAIYPEYKQNRDAPPADLRPQTERVMQLLKLWGVPIVTAEGVEADDVIATLCDRLAERDDLAIRIVSRDKDLEQLIGEHVALYDVHKDETVDLAALRDGKKLTPEQVVDALALMGDNVDNIIGVKGVGPKTAAKLISQYGSIDELLAHTDELSGKLKENILHAKDRLALNRELVTLKRDVDVEFDLEDAAVGDPPVERLRAAFKELGFNRHVRELEELADAKGEAPGGSAAPVTTSRTRDDHIPGGLFEALDESAPPPAARADLDHYQAITTKAELDALVATLREHVRDGRPFAVDTETDQLNPMRAQLCGVCLATAPESGVYIPVRSPDPSGHLDEPTVIDALRPILEDPKARAVGHNLKYDMLILRGAGIDVTRLCANAFDTMVASYLIEPTRPSHKLDNLALHHLRHEMIPITDLIGSGRHQRSMIDIGIDRVTPYAAEDADITLRLHDLLAPKLKVMGLLDLFETLEMPLVAVLAELEYNGVLVDPDELDRQKQTMLDRIGDLYDEILKAAGTDFNPDSPKQLADVLFKRLGTKVYKRGKTGPSTDVEVLQKIADEQPPPQSIVAATTLEYRQLQKLRGTYLESLKEAIDPDTHRIHASFNQTVTATGRLSSSDPNLQNIPIRTELGRQIRKAFIAPPGHVLLGADYSQIELRLLAHLAQDERLMQAFRDDLDIHRAVAAEVFGVALDDVTPEQRGTAKMVNFGIVYGITPYGLARRLPADTAGSSVDVARQIIDDYKRRYPKINQFLAKCVEMADNRGYVETICKRRRAVPEIHDRNPNRAAFGRRIAINTVVQGSAADLIKLAMVKLHDRIRNEGRPLKMLVQIHDELVFETPEGEVEAQSEFVREVMESAMALTVPLKVDASWGGSWFDTK